MKTFVQGQGQQVAISMVNIGGGQEQPWQGGRFSGPAVDKPTNWVWCEFKGSRIAACTCHQQNRKKGDKICHQRKSCKYFNPKEGTNGRVENTGHRKTKGN